MPPERLLQDSVSAVVVKEGASGRRGVRRPRGAQGWVWGSKETWSEDAPAGVSSSPVPHRAGASPQQCHAQYMCTWLQRARPQGLLSGEVPS